MDLHPHEAPKRVHRGELLSFARVEHGGVFVLSSPLLPITLRLQQGTPVSRASSHRLAVWLRDRTGRCRGFHHRHSGEDMTSEAAVEVKCGRPQRVSRRGTARRGEAGVGVAMLSHVTSGGTWSNTHTENVQRVEFHAYIHTIYIYIIVRVYVWWCSKISGHCWEHPKYRRFRWKRLRREFEPAYVGKHQILRLHFRLFSVISGALEATELASPIFETMSLQDAFQAGQKAQDPTADSPKKSRLPWGGTFWGLRKAPEVDHHNVPPCLFAFGFLCWTHAVLSSCHRSTENGVQA